MQVDFRALLPFHRMKEPPMEPSAAAREWGQRQAAASPKWSEDKWRRVAAVLGMELEPTPAKPEYAESRPPAEAA
jgi:hypothetical protein